jgi:hypothetical protein
MRYGQGVKLGSDRPLNHSKAGVFRTLKRTDRQMALCGLAVDVPATAMRTATQVSRYLMGARPSGFRSYMRHLYDRLGSNTDQGMTIRLRLRAINYADD